MVRRVAGDCRPRDSELPGAPTCAGTATGLCDAATPRRRDAAAGIAEIPFRPARDWARPACLLPFSPPPPLGEGGGYSAGVLRARAGGRRRRGSESPTTRTGARSARPHGRARRRIAARRRSAPLVPDGPARPACLRRIVRRMALVPAAAHLTRPGAADPGPTRSARPASSPPVPDSPRGRGTAPSGRFRARRAAARNTAVLAAAAGRSPRPRGHARAVGPTRPTGARPGSRVRSQASDSDET